MRLPLLGLPNWWFQSRRSVVSTPSLNSSRLKWLLGIVLQVGAASVSFNFGQHALPHAFFPTMFLTCQNLSTSPLTRRPSSTIHTAPLTDLKPHQCSIHTQQLTSSLHLLNPSSQHRHHCMTEVVLAIHDRSWMLEWSIAIWVTSRLHWCLVPMKPPHQPHKKWQQKKLDWLIIQFWS